MHTTSLRLVEDLESLWALYDQVFDALDATQWQRKHGKDWVVADLPYHLFYFDRDIVLATLRRGAQLPPEVLRSVPRSMRELDAWNEREFGQRPKNESPE